MLFDLDRIQINKIANTDELKCLTEIINYFDDNYSDIIWDKMNESSSTKNSTYLNKLISIITNESLVAELKNRLEANKEC